MAPSSIYGQVVSPFSPEEIQQSTGFTCAVKSQQLILQLFNIDVSEQELMDEAFDHGLLTTSGTAMPDVGALLEMHGVETTTFMDGNVAILMHELAQGHQVIVGVDSGELWEPFDEYFEDNRPDHALIVTGIDATDPQNVMVIVTDPGCGKVCAYPYDQFVDAWSDSNCFMVATNEAPEIEELENLNEELMDSLMDRAFDSMSDTFHSLVDKGGITNLQELILVFMEEDTTETEIAEDADYTAPMSSSGVEDMTSCTEHESMYDVNELIQYDSDMNIASTDDDLI